MVTHSHRIPTRLIHRTGPERVRPRALSWTVDSVLLAVAVVLAWWAFLTVEPIGARVWGTAAAVLVLLVVGWWWMPPYLALGVVAVTITTVASIHGAVASTAGLHWSFTAIVVALATVIGGCVVIAVLEGLDELWQRLHRG
jgi:hypothetical protein